MAGMRVRSFIILAALCSAPGSGRPARAAEAGPERTVAVISFAVDAGLSEARVAIAESIARGLESGAFVAAPGQPLFVEGDVGPACADPECFAALGQRLGVRFFARADITSRTDAFSVTVVITRAADGRELARHTLTCESLDPCAPVPESARSTARDAARKALGVLSTEPTVGAAARDARPARRHQAPGAAIDGGVASAAAQGSPSGISPWWFAASGTVAAAAVGTGIFLLAMRGDETDCSTLNGKPWCPREHDDLWLGIGTTAAGTALAVATAVGYFRWGARQETRVAITPGGVSFTGRF